MDMLEEMEIEEVAEKVKKHSGLYYAGKAEISDEEFDALEDKLRGLDPNNAYFSTVGADIKSSSFAKVPHDVPMLSLDKAYSLEEVVKWAPEVAVMGVGMPKMDGFALSLKYLKNSTGAYDLVRAATRGKGESGEDVTENAKRIEDIPKVITVDLGIDAFEVRGEAYMTHSVFEELDLASQGYENCRNIAPGSVRHKNPEVTAGRKLNFFGYNILGLPVNAGLSANLGLCEDKMSLRFRVLHEIGFKEVPYVTLKLVASEMEASYNKLVAQRDIDDFDTDGVVFCIDDCNEIERLGCTSHHPRAFIAWKFASEEAETTLKEIKLQVSRTGMINPVGIFNSVKVEGGNLTNATLHNYTEIEKLGIGVGDKIIVSRRGGVIPKIEKVVTSAGNKFEIPTKCPVCGEPAEVRQEKDSKTVHCVNIECPAVTMTRILHFIQVIEIDGVAEGMLTKLMDAGYVKTPADLYTVTKEQLLTLDGVKDRSADKYLNAVKLSKKRSLAQFLNSLGIHSLGRSVSSDVADVFGTLEGVCSASEADFAAIDGIGPEISKNVSVGLARSKDLIAALTNHIEVVSKEAPSEDDNLPLSGKSFLITGTLSKGRKAITEMIKENGGDVRSSVSKTLGYLVLGDNPGGKLSKAKKAGTTIISEEEFLEMIQ